MAILVETMAIVSGQLSSRDIMLIGLVQGNTVKILIDSGSSHSFLHKDLTAKLPGGTTFSPPIQVKVTNGSSVACSVEFLQLPWKVQGYHFVADFKVPVLPLNDIIVALWAWIGYLCIVLCKWVGTTSSCRFRMGKHISVAGRVIWIVSWFRWLWCCQKVLLVNWRRCIRRFQLFLAKFQSVFEPFSGYPPARHCDHAVLLLPKPLW